MKDTAWELFEKTGLPQAYCYYKARERRAGAAGVTREALADAHRRKRAGDTLGGLQG